ncbi:hypothetical protein Hamer_G026646 [Homarus americanus]|uniref:Uncharacterized protein n=1 Tax=Homarus americanus TaxID=6706 RepID=A0A8J5JLW0_HOMAM|nr:hypothetical protein Hamer_G026646 [Homarus americanus]
MFTLYSTNSVAAYNYVFTLQHQQCLAAYNYVFYSGTQQCGSLQLCIYSTAPTVWRPATMCLLYSTNSVAAYNHVFTLQHQQLWRPTTMFYSTLSNSAAAYNYVYSTAPTVWRPTTMWYITSSVAAYNYVTSPASGGLQHVFTLQHQQCGGLQLCVTS